MTVRLTPAVYAELLDLAARERRTLSDKARLLLEDAVARGGAPAWQRPQRRGRVSEEMRQGLHEAVELLLERAPSAVVEELNRWLTARAGRYGSE